MADIFKRLGAVTATRNLVPLVTVPANTRMTVNINVCNKHINPIKINIMHIDGAGVTGSAPEDYIVFKETVPGHKSTVYARGITASWTDTIGVSASTPHPSASVCFIAWGIITK